MKYNFTLEELKQIDAWHHCYGPRGAYKAYTRNHYMLNVTTEDVEDFIIAFYEQRNAVLGVKY
jgi:hypothetical protein